MLISVHDKNLRRVTYLDNEKPKTLHYCDDTWHRYLTEATSTFDFSVPKTGHPDIEFLTEKGYVSFRYEGKSYLFNIMKVEETEKKLTCYCENLNLELLNETSPEYKATGAKTFVQYLTLLGMQYAQMEIGINEVSDLSRTLEWTGQDTKLARLLSLVNKFDAECEFVTHLNRDGTLDKIVLNVYRKHDDSHQGVGTRRKDVTLYYGKEIKEIRRTVDKTGLYTAIKPIGTDGLNISTLDKTELDEDGNVLFRSSNGDTHILCPPLRDEYPSQVVDPTGDRYINLDWTYETKNVNTLYGQALAKLKSVYMPAITYEVDGFIKLEIGDTIKMHDAGFAPTLLLEARVSEQEISFSKPDRNKTIFSNFRALENKLSADIQSRLETLVQEAVPYKADIFTTDGLIFKNGEGSTTLTARISKGNAILTNQLSVLWYKDGVAFSTSESVTVRAEDIESKAVYRFEGLDAEGVTKCFAEVTIADVSDGTPGETGAPGKPGADGKTPYLHIAYATSADGKTGFSISDSTNKTYIGQYTDYAQSDSTDPAKYAWTRIKGEDGKSSYTHIRYALDSTGLGMTDKPSLWDSSGQNLIRNTNTTFEYKNTAGTPSLTDFTPSYPSYVYNTGQTQQQFFIQNDIKSGDKITASVVIELFKINGIFDVNDFPNETFVSALRFGGSGTSWGTMASLHKYDLVSGQTIYKKIAVRTVSDGDVLNPGYSDSKVRYRISKFPGGYGFRIKEHSFKLERGSTATPWTPAPEDYPEDWVQPYIGIATTDSAVAPTDASAYTWSKYVGKDGKDGTDGKDGAPGAPGKDGQNPIVGELSFNPIPLPATSTGTVVSFTDAKGYFRVYDGKTLLTNGVTYSLVSASGVTASINSTGAYTVTAMPQGTDFGTAIFKAVYNGVETQKILSVIKSKQGEKGATGGTGPAGKDGAKGDPTGITVSATEPTSKYTGMLWKNTGTAGGRIKDALYCWNGSAWELYLFVAENIQATTLSAITTNLGTVNAGTINGVDINGSEFNNDFDFTSSGEVKVKGSSQIKGGEVRIESKLESSSINQWLTSVLKYDGITIESSGAGLGTHITEVTDRSVSFENALIKTMMYDNGISVAEINGGLAVISPGALVLRDTAQKNVTISPDTYKQIQCGRTKDLIAVPGGSYKDYNIALSGFSDTPLIFLTFYAASQNTKYLGLAYLNESESGFTIRVTNSGSAQYSVYVNWLAVL